MVEQLRVREDTKVALLRQAIARDPESSHLLFALADLLAERGELDEYARTFQRAYQLAPALQPLAEKWSLDVRAQRARTLRNKAQALLERGVNYSSVIAAQAISSAMLGDRETVERLLDYRRFFITISRVWPREFSDSDFFGALAAEISDGLKFYDSPTDRAIHKAWRRDDILNSQSAVCRALAREIRTQVEQYISKLPLEASHPFVASRPLEFTIDGWAVVSNSESYHHSHIHPVAWASGVYYVVRPSVSREADSECGWLRVGPPQDFGIASRDGWDTRMVAPEPGTLVLMPGYFYHETRPMGIDQERICIAFDVSPIELARWQR